jgi:fatty acid desaturase
MMIMVDTATAEVDPAARRSRGIEWPTLALAVVIYSCWVAVTLFHARLPWWATAALGSWLVAWHSSLQHEILHGHPTRSRTFNTALGFPPLALWIPYERYRATHLKHHHDERLTDPLDDPESRYWRPEDWARLAPWQQRLVRAQATLAGRLTIGPFWAIATFLTDEWAAIRAGDRRLARVWAGHMAAVAALAAWLELACGMSIAFYVIAIVIPGTSLMLIRSFAEHRANREVAHRTAIVESASPLALLFLYNNLHAAHHARPDIPWYRLPRFYRDNRERFVRGNGGLVYGGYRDVVRRFWLRPHDAPLHPLGRAPGRSKDGA